MTETKRCSFPKTTACKICPDQKICKTPMTEEDEYRMACIDFEVSN